MVAEDVQVLVGQVRGSAASTNARISSRSSGVVSRRLALQALLDRRVAADPAEDEHDRGQQALAVEPVDHVDAARDPDPRPLPTSGASSRLAARCACARRSRVSRVLAQSSRATRISSRVDRRALVDEPAAASTSGRRTGRTAAGRPSRAGRAAPVGAPRRSWSVSPRTVSSHSPNSSALDTVADRRDQRHRLGQVDDHLLPDRAAGPVGEVVHLVHHHEAAARAASREPAYSMLRSTSVVITTTGASPLIALSPVSRPTWSAP